MFRYLVYGSGLFPADARRLCPATAARRGAQGQIQTLPLQRLCRGLWQSLCLLRYCVKVCMYSEWELSWPICVCFESVNVPHKAWNLTSFLYICLSHQLGIFVNANSYISIRQSFPAIIPSDDKEIHHQLKLITKVVLCQILVPTLEVNSLIVSLCFLQSHFQLQLCPGADCPMVIKVQEPRARRVQCSRCSEVFW